MCHDVIEAKYIEEYKIAVTFEDGKKGIVDFKDYAKAGGVFGHFADMEYFKKFYINTEIGVWCGPDNVDIAPETLYHKATGEPLPEWMQTGEDRKKAV